MVSQISESLISSWEMLVFEPVVAFQLLCRFGLVHMSKVSVCACHMTVMRLKSAFEVCISMLCIAPDVVCVCVSVCLSSHASFLITPHANSLCASSAVCFSRLCGCPLRVCSIELKYFA